MPDLGGAWLMGPQGLDLLCQSPRLMGGRLAGLSGTSLQPWCCLVLPGRGRGAPEPNG